MRVKPLVSLMAILAFGIIIFAPIAHHTGVAMADASVMMIQEVKPLGGKVTIGGVTAEADCLDPHFFGDHPDVFWAKILAVQELLDGNAPADARRCNQDPDKWVLIATVWGVPALILVAVYTGGRWLFKTGFQRSNESADSYADRQ